MIKSKTRIVTFFSLFLLALSLPAVSEKTDPSTATSVLPDGSKYSGEYKNNRFHGQGSIVWPNGDRYTGNFKQGMMHGKGVIKWINGETYSGDFKNGMMHGHGELLMGSKDIYKGSFKDGFMHGSGELLLITGDIYTGGFSKGYMSGQGEYIYSNGTRYEGEFDLSKFHGSGKFYLDNGDFYSGEFKHGLMHGKGIFKTKGGRVFEGDFEMDVFTGSGTLVYDKDNKYTGEFKDWEFHGQGELVTVTGDIYKGTFKNGQLVGKGSHISSKGSTYIGEFKNWTYDGKGELTKKNGEKHVGLFQYGRPHGEGKSIKLDKSGKETVITGNWQYGFLNDEEERKRREREKRIERALYGQKQALNNTLTQLDPGTRGKIDLYFLGVAGHGEQDVFMKEVAYISKQFQQAYGTSGRSIQLINSKSQTAAHPLATVTSIKQAIAEIESKMNTEEDILFLYMTSHGSDKHVFNISYDGMSLPDITAEQLAEILNQTSIKYRVVMVSACYSGGFIKPVENANTLVMTAAAKDRKSFGCSDENEITDFARAYFMDSLPGAESFEDAFNKAHKIVTREEKKRKIKQHSSPQFSMGQEIRNQLAKWREQIGH